MNKWFEAILGSSKILTFIFIMILFFGIKSFVDLKKDVFPLTDIDTMIIQVTSQGSSAKDVEVNSVIPIEQKIKEISGITGYNSVSNPNSALIYIYLERELNNTQTVKDEIYRTISKDNIENLGEGVDEIKVIDANPKLMPVINLALTTKDDENILKLFEKARKIQKSLERLPGVSEVRMTGLEDPEVHIEVNPSLLKKYYISIENVWMALRDRTVTINGGSLQSLKSNETIVTVSRFSSLDEIKNVVIRSNFSGKGVLVKDVASVKTWHKKENNIFRADGHRGVLFQVTKRASSDVLSVVKHVKKWMKSGFKGEMAGEEYKLQIISDKGDSIDSMLDVLKSNALIGFILVFICLLLFLDLKTSIWTALGIPISLLITAIGMSLFDISINIITLGAMITVLGMLVDDGIVVAEGMYKSREAKLNRSDTAKELSKLFWPLAVTIATTIVAFLPLVQIGGMMGKFIKFYPVVISIILVASLFESTVLLPHHLKNTKEIKEKKWFTVILSYYETMIEWSIRRKPVIFSFFILIIIVGSFVGVRSFKKFVLLWDDSSEGIYVNVELPEGTSIQIMDQELKQLSASLSKKIPKKYYKNIQSVAGHHTVKRIHSEGNRENWGQILINLIPKSERSITAKQLISMINKELKKEKWPFTSLSLEEQVMGPSPGKGLELAIIGKTHENRVALLQTIEKYINKQNGVISVKTSGLSSVNELRIVFDFEKMATLGITVAKVSQTIRAAFNGIIATEDSLADYTLNYRVQLSEDFKGDKKTLMRLLVPNKDKKLIPLNTFAGLKYQSGIGQVQHMDGEAVLLIKVQTKPSLLTSRQLARKVKTWWGTNSNKFPSMKVIIKGEAKETKDSIKDLITAMVVSIVLIYMVLVILFNSYLVPLIIFSVIPCGIFGAIIAFVFHSIPLNFMGIVGIIGLSGILVNDSIIMVSSFINSDDMGVKDVAIGRFRPILLTTLTTVFGLLPSVYGIGGDLKTLVPVVVALCYGLIIGTLANLFLLPVNLSLFRWFTQKTK